MERFLGSIAGRPPRELPDGARSRSRSPHGYRPPQLRGRPVRRSACPLARTAQTPGYNRPVSETEPQEPKKPRFFSRIFGGGGESDQHKSLTKMDSLAAYVIREHRSGRPLHEILEDPYLKNRATDEQRLRLLDRRRHSRRR